MVIPTLPQDTDAEQLAQTIERLVVTKRMSYLDAVIYYCAEKNIEPELIAATPVSYTHLTLPTNREV